MISPAAAQIGSDRYASIIVDANTGAILSESSMDEKRYPASLTKMMTLYMLFEALRDRRVRLDQNVPISASAASMPPTKLGLQPGGRVTVEQAILGLVTKSANDAAAALGEMLGGDESRFAQMMTAKARALGMTRTTFRNASGLPDWQQATSARDMAVLARRLIQDFPNYYHYFSTPSFVYAGRIIRSHQRLLKDYPGADGLKTGYIDASGFNVVTSAVRGKRRLIGVVMGASSSQERDLHMARLLDQGFDQLGVPTLLVRGDPVRRLAPIIGYARAQAPGRATTAGVSKLRKKDKAAIKRTTRRTAQKRATPARASKRTLRPKPSRSRKLGRATPRLRAKKAIASKRKPAQRRRDAAAAKAQAGPGARSAGKRMAQPQAKLAASGRKASRSKVRATKRRQASGAAMRKSTAAERVALDRNPASRPPG